MPDRGKYIEILSKAVKTVKEFNEDTPIKISLECVEDVLELLKENEDFFDWLACSVVMDDSNWEQFPGFYREVICRKLVRLGIIELKDDEYALPEPKRT